jgi:hypothetical protein
MKTSFRTISSVAGVAEAGKNECAVIEILVDPSRPDWHVGMQVAQLLQALPRRQKADITDLFRPPLF